MGASQALYIILSCTEPPEIFNCPRQSSALQLGRMSSIILETPTVASVETHTMGNSLFEYLRMNVHPEIQQREWKRIIVLGGHVRTGGTQISAIEKNDKPFNWQRPTAKVVDVDTIHLFCFPGIDYVKHYAAILATYLSLNEKDPKVVSYEVPSSAESMRPLLQSNLQELGRIEIAVLGYVQGLPLFTSASWTGGEDELFSWQIGNLPNGGRVAFIGCRVSFWGDIAGNVVRALQQLSQVKCVLYVGKLGTLRPELSPNTLLATGNSSFVHGELLTWQNPLEPFFRASPTIRHGRHYTLPSVLDETKDWLAERSGDTDWVDPEIGHMAKASLDGNTKFGFLHIISDSLARKYKHDLSSERVEEVLQNRENIVGEIQRVLQELFEAGLSE